MFTFLLHASALKTRTSAPIHSSESQVWLDFLVILDSLFVLKKKIDDCFNLQFSSKNPISNPHLTPHVQTIYVLTENHDETTDHSILFDTNISILFTTSTQKQNS